MSQTHKVGNHKTTIYTVNGKTTIVYHSTPVVTFNNHSIWLDSGGWRTATTKLRMNQASNQFGLGYQVYQKNYVWYVDYQGKRHEFHDGMSFPRG